MPKNEIATVPLNNDTLALLQAVQADAGKGMESVTTNDLIRSDVQLITTKGHFAMDAFPGAKVGDFIDDTSKTNFGGNLNMVLFEAPFLTINEIRDPNKTVGELYWGEPYSLTTFSKLVAKPCPLTESDADELFHPELNIFVRVKLHLFGAAVDDKGGVQPIRFPQHKVISPENERSLKKQLNTLLAAGVQPIYLNVLTFSSNPYTSKAGRTSQVMNVASRRALAKLNDTGTGFTDDSFIQDPEALRRAITAIKVEFDNYHATPPNTGFRATYNVVYDEKTTPDAAPTTAGKATSAQTTEDITASIKGF